MQCKVLQRKYVFQYKYPKSNQPIKQSIMNCYCLIVDVIDNRLGLGLGLCFSLRCTFQVYIHTCSFSLLSSLKNKFYF